MLGRSPDARLLAEDMAALPESERRPAPRPRSRARGRIVSLGAALTGLTLVLGAVLLVAGVVAAIAGGLDGLVLAALAGGALLVATHWGWVHVAEAAGLALERRHRERLDPDERAWLARIEPYTRWSVRTRALDDGSIRTEVVRHEPVAAGETTFTFRSIVERAELHAPDDPGAAVAEGAEALRREAALASAREQGRWRALADERALAAGEIDADDERRSTRRAESQALSDRINERLREQPPDESDLE